MPKIHAARIQNGKIVTKKQRIPLRNLRITFINQAGSEITPGDGSPIMQHQFYVAGSNINTSLVKSVWFPKLDYTQSDEVIVTVESYVLDD